MTEHEKLKTLGVRHLALMASTFGAVAVGAFALGALAIGRLAVGRLSVGSTKSKEVRNRGIDRQTAQRVANRPTLGGAVASSF